MKRIALVDDHVIVRSGLKVLIEKLGPYRVTLQFDNGEQLMRAIPFSDPPDLIVLDISMPVMGGDVVMKLLNQQKVTIPVLVLTLNRSETLIAKLFRLGVRGYLPKDCSAEDMRQALDEIIETGYYHNEFTTLSLKNTDADPEITREGILERLSQREKEFLGMVCNENEYTYEQIADKMGVHHRTVDGYRESLFEKFGIKSKTGLVLFVLKNRLFDHLVK